MKRTKSGKKKKKKEGMIFRHLTSSRAYIAASRRSDRCLEARMESARRASVIHEKRTGRALRITEADVVNEEMYEEVNDLPSQYRRLSAHLQTESAAFDRRLLAYLSSQIATRQAVSDCWQNGQSTCDPHLINPSTMSESHVQMPMYQTSETSHRQMPYHQSAQHSMQSPQHFQPYSNETQYPPGFNQQYAQSRPPSASRSDSISRVDSAVDMTGVSPTFHHPFDPRLQHQTSQTFKGQHFNPLSPNLPISSQQLLSNQYQSHRPDEGGSFVSAPPQEFTGRRYSYNPNKRLETASSSPNHQNFAMPVGTAQFGSSPSPLWLDTHAGVSPSTSSGGSFPQVYHTSPHDGAQPHFPKDRVHGKQ